MRVVLLDTATAVVGVAAYWDGQCVSAETARIQAGADGWLTPAIARALALLSGLDAVAVVTGPGAFTGLRVGLAHGLGLAFARAVPVIALPTLQLRAATAPGHARVLALLDARKGRLYAQSFDTSGDVPLALDAAQDIAPDALALAGAVIVGEGLDAAAGALDRLGVHGLRLPDDAALRSAGSLIRSLPPVDPSLVAPYYLRPPDAQPSVLLH